MKYCNINEHNFQYFKPLLQEDQQIRMMTDPGICGLGCYDKDTACGILLYTVEEAYPAIRILYVSVSFSWQNRGVATGLIRSLAETAYEEGYITLASFYAADRNDPRYAMFENTEEFTIEQLPGGVYVVDSDGLKDLIHGMPPAEYDRNISGTRSTLSKCPVRIKEKMYGLLKASGLELSQTRPAVDEDLSFTVLDKKGAPTALTLISYFEDRNLYEVSFVRSFQPERVDLIDTLLQSLTDIHDRMKPQDTLRFSTPVESMDKLAEKYFSHKYKTEYFYRAGYNGDTVG